MASSPTRADKASVNQSFHALMRLLRYAKGYRRQIITATICSIINKLFDIAPEILIGVAIDVVVNQENSFVARKTLRVMRMTTAFYSFYGFLLSLLIAFRVNSANQRW